jgi:hypothetical protein
MSEWSERLLTRLDYPTIFRQRRRNFTLLAERLAESGIAPWCELEPGVCPLFFPLLVKDKPAAARLLKSRGIMATELWNEGDPLFAAQEGTPAKFLRRHLLELPIHQDIGEAHILYMAREVAEQNIALSDTTTQRSTPAGRRGRSSQQPVAS